MYSLSTCDHCKRKRQALINNRIQFAEYSVDLDSSKNTELNEKLSRSGYTRKAYGTPIMNVYGVMVPDNPSLYYQEIHRTTLLNINHVPENWQTTLNNFR